MIRTLPSCALALLLLGCSLRLSAQHAIDSGRGLAMARPERIYPFPEDRRYTFDEPTHHLGIQMQGGLAYIDDYSYSLGPTDATVIADHLAPYTLTALAVYHTRLFNAPFAIALGYQRTSLRSGVDYPGVPLRRPEGDTIVGVVEFDARNSAESIVLDVALELITLRTGPGELFARTGLRNRTSFRQDRNESISVPESGEGMLIALGDRVAYENNGARALVTSTEESDFGLDVAVNVGIGWRIGFPTMEDSTSEEPEEPSEFDEFTFDVPYELEEGPILIIPTIDFYLPVIGSHPIEQASWEVQMGVGFVVPL